MPLSPAPLKAYLYREIGIPAESGEDVPSLIVLTLFLTLSPHARYIEKSIVFPALPTFSSPR